MLVGLVMWEHRSEGEFWSFNMLLIFELCIILILHANLNLTALPSVDVFEGAAGLCSPFVGEGQERLLPRWHL